MAKFANAVNYAKSIDPSSENILDPGLFSGKVRVMQDYYDQGASTMATLDYIVVGGKLPTGSQIVKIILTMGTPLTTQCSVQLGDEGDVNRYITSYILTAGEVLVGPNNATGMYYTVTGVTDNYLRLSTAIGSTTLSGADVKVSVMYVVE